MSDEQPPPKKVGSLRDRIAAFEQKPTANAPAPPAPRPKPGHVQWKPRASSPPPVGTGASGSESESVGMNTSDAKESIGLGGLSLKERMAALRGQGAFAAPSPAPGPPVHNKPPPKWKIPSETVSPTEHAPEAGADQEQIAPESVRASVRSPVSASDAEASEAAPEVTDSEKPVTPAGEGEPTAEGEDDPDEEERKRRAAIAARMARLGGARFGMGPPVFAPKSRSSTTSQHTEGEPAESADEAGSPGSGMKIDLPSAPSQTSLTSGDESARSPPTHMPVPTGPRRAGPPRRRPPKSPGVGSGELPPTPLEREEGSTPLGTDKRDEKKLEEEEEAEEIPEEETEEEAAARRKRIADRIAKSGGFNPFAMPKSEPEPEPEQELEPEPEHEHEHEHEHEQVQPQVEEQVKADTEIEVEAPAEVPADVEAETEAEAEAPPPSSDVEDGTPPPPPPKRVDTEEHKVAEDPSSPVAFPSSYDPNDPNKPIDFPAKYAEPTETTAPVLNLANPAEVSTMLEDAEKNITDAVEDPEDPEMNAEPRTSTDTNTPTSPGTEGKKSKKGKKGKKNGK